MLYAIITICAVIFLVLGINGRAKIRAQRELVRMWPQFQRSAVEKINEPSSGQAQDEMRWQTLRFGNVGVAYAVEHAGDQYVHRIGVKGLSRLAGQRTQREFLMVCMAQLLPLLGQFPKEEQPKVDISREKDGAEMLILWLSARQHQRLRDKMGL